MYVVFLLHDRSLICKFSVEKVVAGYLNTSRPFCVVVLVFVRFFQPVCATLAFFRFVSASFTLTTMAVGNTSEDFASVLSPWSIWALKNSSNGTNIPHACIPGARLAKTSTSISTFELKVGEFGFLIHFVCVSAALYHRGHAAAIFPLRWIVHWLSIP